MNQKRSSIRMMSMQQQVAAASTKHHTKAAEQAQQTHSCATTLRSLDDSVGTFNQILSMWLLGKLRRTHP